MRYILIIFTFLYSSNAYAYIDPGIGSILLQSIIAGFAIFMGWITLYWSKFKNFISYIIKKLKKN